MWSFCIVAIKTERIVPVCMFIRYVIIKTVHETIPCIFTHTLYIGTLILKKRYHGGDHLQGLPDVLVLSDTFPVLEENGVSCPCLYVLHGKEQYQTGGKIEHADRSCFIQSSSCVNENALGSIPVVEFLQEAKESTRPGNTFSLIHARHPCTTHLGNIISVPFAMCRDDNNFSLTAVSQRTCPPEAVLYRIAIPHHVFHEPVKETVLWTAILWEQTAGEAWRLQIHIHYHDFFSQLCKIPGCGCQCC